MKEKLSAKLLFFFFNLFAVKEYNDFYSVVPQASKERVLECLNVCEFFCSANPYVLLGFCLFVCLCVYSLFLLPACLEKK